MKLVNSEQLFDRKNGEEFYSKNSRPIIIAIGLRSPSNLGSLIRLSANLGASRLMISSNVDSFKSNKIRRMSMNSIDVVDWQIMTVDEIFSAIPSDYQVVAVETTDMATDIFKTMLPSKIAFVFGGETAGLSNEVLNRCHSSVYIPMFGHSLSMNISHATAVAGFEWLRQMAEIEFPTSTR